MSANAAMTEAERDRGAEGLESDAMRSPARIGRHNGPAVGRLADRTEGQVIDGRRWRAVLIRDRRADGRFVFAVRSTGIYCRPSCPARRPRREHVRVFAGSDDARRAGYRACRRCRPDVPTVGAAGTGADLVRRVCRHIEAHRDEPLRLPALAAALGYGPHHLRRTFTRVLGLTPKRYLDACRLDLVKARLRAQSAVTAALYDAGYGSSSRLYERAPDRLGMTPAAYRRGGSGVAIRYTISDAPPGRVLIGATDRGVCAVSLGDSDARLTASLRAEYPAARITRDDDGLGSTVRALLAYLDGRRPPVDLPLDIRATAFQGRVWDALRAIPYGATRSYSDVARAIGRPTAVRAVARACAANPVSLLIPCHRVIREDGGLGGYRWGAERKRMLLSRERRPAAATGGA